MRRVYRRRSFALSDIGRVRESNEDAFLADDTLGLYVVCDGVGGLPHGEVASAESCAQVRNFVVGGHEALERFLFGGPPAAELPSNDDVIRPVRRLLDAAVQSACYFIRGLAEQEPAQVGMSTTVSALLLAGDTGIVAQVGDSRIYRLRDGEAAQITDDHTVAAYRQKKGLMSAEEASRSPSRHLLTRALGPRDWAEVDTFTFELKSGDRFFLCTDGCHEYVGSQELRSILAGTVEEASRQAIAMANLRGGHDNITAVTVGVR